MRQRDFFAFCTGLKPVELRAIGELSWVRHLNEGEQLYAPGEPGNALYIVNRGVIQASWTSRRQRTKSVGLGRGEIIGDIEVFCDIRRTQTERAIQPASLQCFPRNNFPELLRRVPSFYRFLCEQMAARLVSEREVAAEFDDSLELSGSISNFDLTTIHQTIMSSGQTGELAIKHENGEVLGAFYFENGRPATAQFQHLTGDEAFWQLFLTDQLAGTFSFAAGERALTASISAPIASKGDLLINALQYRDEFEALKSGVENYGGKLRVRAGTLSWNGQAPPELRELAEHIWELITRGPKTIAEIYRQSSVCELKILRVVAELLYSNQLGFVGSAEPAAMAPALVEG
jgi:CRP-like cAMP-binding protein